MGTPSPPSKILNLQQDSAVVQDASYAFNDADRAYIDSQNLGVQGFLLQCLLLGIHATFYTLDPESAAASMGDVVCSASTGTQTVTRALATPLGLAGATIGVVLIGAAPGARALVAMHGIIPASITGIVGTGVAQFAIVSSSARSEVVSSLSVGDFPLGSVDGAGNLTLLSGDGAVTSSGGGGGGGVSAVTGTAPITSSGGPTPNIAISAATDSSAGTMSATDKAKLDGLAAYNAAWYALTDIYWDPTSGNDGNTGTTSGSPILTWTEIVRRYGSDSPLFNYGQSVTIHKLSAQPAGQDPVFFAPKLSNGGRAILLDTPTAVTTVTAGTVTARNRSAGTLLKIASMPGGTAANQLVHNTTRGSYAFVDSMSGSTATMQQPIKASVVNTIGIPNVGTESTVEDNTWTTGDTLVISQCQALNLKLWAPVGGDVSTGGQASLGWVQFAHIVDPSGSNLSSFSFLGSTTNILSMCQIDSQMTVTNTLAINGVFLIGCTVGGGLVNISGPVFVCAGAYASSMFVATSDFTLNGDTVIHGTLLCFGGALLEVQSFYCDGFVGISSCTMQCLIAGSAVWGPAVMSLGEQGAFQVSGGTGNTFTDALLLTGQISFGNVLVGWPSAGLANEGGTFTLNGNTQVTVTGLFPANAPIAISLATVGSTPGTGAPYFSQAQIANSFFIKSPTTGANDVYNWQAISAPVTITPANMTTYRGLWEPSIGARFAIET